MEASAATPAKAPPARLLVESADVGSTITPSSFFSWTCAATFLSICMLGCRYSPDSSIAEAGFPLLPPPEGKSRSRVGTPAKEDKLNNHYRPTEDCFPLLVGARYAQDCINWLVAASPGQEILVVEHGI